VNDEGLCTCYVGVQVVKGKFLGIFGNTLGSYSYSKQLYKFLEVATRHSLWTYINFQSHFIALTAKKALLHK